MSCSICGGDVVEHVRQAHFTYFRCVECGTSALWPQPAESELDLFYGRYHLPAQEGGLFSEFEDRMRADQAAKLRGIRRLGPSLAAPRLLDIGCGKGYFLADARAAGFRVDGIDVSENAVLHAQMNLGVAAIAGHLDLVEKPDWVGAFDVATLWATVEHLRDPATVLRATLTYLKPGGFLFLDTGLAGRFLEGWLAGHTQWYDAPQHLFVFSKKGLRMTLESAGFKVLRVTTNWDRTAARRVVRAVRYAFLCTVPSLFVVPVLGLRGFRRLKMEAKWPVGSLMSLVAQRPW